MNIQDQVVLVTGGARGLGEVITRILIAQGARVVVNYYKSVHRAEQIQQEFGSQVFCYQADVTNKAEVEDLFFEAKTFFGQPINSVINNALINFEFNGDARPKIEDLSWSTMTNQLEGALKAALNTTQEALDDMKAHNFGRIINIGTNLVQNPVVPYHDYIAAKASMLGFTRSAAHELGSFGINVNMVSGGLLKMTDASRSTPGFVFDLIAASTPQNKTISPEEFADAVVMLLGSMARAITGQNLVVDGGLVKD